MRFYSKSVSETTLSFPQSHPRKPFPPLLRRLFFSRPHLHIRKNVAEGCEGRGTVVILITTGEPRSGVGRPARGRGYTRSMESTSRISGRIREELPSIVA